MWHYWCYPKKLAASNNPDDKQKARDATLSMIFLAGADKKRYGTMIEELNNSYLSKKDNYPTLIDDVLTLLSHYQDHKVGDHKVSDDTLRATSFAQYKRQLSRICCFGCGEKGHVKKDCPCRRQNHNQMEDDDDDGSTGTTGSNTQGSNTQCVSWVT